jgi:hypothetical protein
MKIRKDQPLINDEALALCFPVYLCALQDLSINVCFNYSMMLF